jgi:vacuolar-type H+-ATPase subunit F/Vma7
MKVLVIGHPDAVLGFSLAGVGGRVASTADEVNQALDDVASAKDVGIVLVTQDVAEMIPARMEHLKLRSTIPLVVEIPRAAAFRRDRHRLAILSCGRSVSSYNPFLTQENELEVYL